MLRWKCMILDRKPMQTLQWEKQEHLSLHFTLSFIQLSFTVDGWWCRQHYQEDYWAEDHLCWRHPFPGSGRLQAEDLEALWMELCPRWSIGRLSCISSNLCSWTGHGTAFLADLCPGRQYPHEGQNICLQTGPEVFSAFYWMNVAPRITVLLLFFYTFN